MTHLNSPELADSRPLLFISWAGPVGRKIAHKLKTWLELTLPQTESWVSDNIPTGDDFFRTLTLKLKTARVCIFCITSDVSRSTWMSFEAGFAQANNGCLIVPILFSKPDEANKSPFASLQCIETAALTTKAGIRKCLSDIIRHLKIDDPGLDRRFRSHWRSFESQIHTSQLGEGATDAHFPNHRLLLSPELEDRKTDLTISNEILKAATSLEILALTYDTLSAAITNMRFPNLERVTIKTYAVPNQRHTHPKYRDNYQTLLSEWTQCVKIVLNAFCSRTLCPKLTELTCVILSTTPDFTGTKADWNFDGLVGTRLRLTICVSGSEMDDLPTFIIDDDPVGESVSFKRFEKMFRSTGLKPATPLAFRLSPSASAEMIDKFVQCASGVTNHPAILSQSDMQFYLSVKGIHESGLAERALDTFDIHKVFNGPLVQPSGSTTPKWTLTPGNKAPVSSLVIQSTVLTTFSTHIPHFFANFVVLLNARYEVVLINYKKGQWNWDIPGGKYATDDDCPRANVCREVFEELGWILNKSELRGPVGLKYEPKSTHEMAMPGVIQYFYYILDPRRDWPCGCEVLPLKSTKDHGLWYCPIDDLIKGKREETTTENRFGADGTLCHIPLPILEQIKLEIESSMSLKDGLR